MEARVTDEDLERERELVDPPLRTREELVYYRIFSEHLAGVRPESTVARFATA
jgi:asparagine synthase (glutamine-hydrolysing)